MDYLSVSEIGSASIVICTYGCDTTLENTLLCLQYLEGPPFEVCVVAHQTDRGAAKVLKEWDGRIKLVQTTERNSSIRYNIGIALADAPIVGFIDDNGLPEPEWLRQVLDGFVAPNVAVAGGTIMDRTGARPQYCYASANRLGRADWRRTAPADYYNFPYSYNFPCVFGTNSAFGREALLGIGGFDEEYELYLAVTDACCRLIDAGFKIVHLPNATVHPKFAASTVRASDRATLAQFSILKDKLYFSLVNNKAHYPLRRAIDDMTAFVCECETACHQADSRAFYADVDRAWEVGLARGLRSERRLFSTALLDRYATPFLPFPRRIPIDGRETFVFVSQQFTPDRLGVIGPDRLGGIGRHMCETSRAVAALGHQVHVVTLGESYDRVDFEEGVWVHRTVTRNGFCIAQADVPLEHWNRSCTVLNEVRGISEARPVTAVHAPIWCCQGAAVMIDRTFPLVIGLYTPLRSWLEGYPHLAADPNIQRDFIRPMLKLEQRMMLECDGMHADSSAVISEIETKYGIVLDRSRTNVIYPGIADWAQLPAISSAPVPSEAVRLLFVGRLERRKGIDVLLSVLPGLIAKYPHLFVDIVGNDTIPGPDGETYRAMFEKAAAPAALNRVRFHGEVAEGRLRGFYRDCDIVTLPSRFESFGLVVLEAMIFGKPVVACRCSGMMEVAADGLTALLGTPGDASSLASGLERLIEDPALRRRFGDAGRRRYEDRFTPGAMAEAVVTLLRHARARHNLGDM